MHLDRVAALQLGLLLLAVPAQYILSTYILPSTQESRAHAITALTKKVIGFKDGYLSLKTWKKWCVDMLQKLQKREAFTDSAKDAAAAANNGESPALEVIKYRDPEGYFAGGAEPRSPRPSTVKFRIGQVVKHKRWGYRGIVVGWDASAKAPEHWFQQMHPPDKSHWRHQPNYAILVDTRDRLAPQTTYVPQENIEVIVNTKVIHPQVDEFFEGFDGAQYIPRPWVKTTYPHD